MEHFLMQKETARSSQGNMNVVGLDKNTNGRKDFKSEIPTPEVSGDESKVNEEVAQIPLDFSNAAVYAR